MKQIISLLRYFKFVFVLFLLIVTIMLTTGRRNFIGPALIIMFSSLALFFMSHPVLKSFAFTAWVFAFVAASMVYPVAFMIWFGFDLKILIVPLIQIIMFGMGTTLCLADFGRVFKMPWPVFVGFVLQFSIMPLTGLALATIFGFEPKVAAGVVLIGSCPGGVASNLMTYIAGGNVALSVTMTSCSTLISPIITPFLMDKLAGQFVEIKFLSMMFSIINMIIVPIVAGLIANRILYSKHKAFHKSSVLASIAAVCILLGIAMIQYAPANVLTFGDANLKKDGFIVGLMLIAIVALAKLVISVWLKGPENWMDKALPIVSMAGICYIIAIITARSAEELRSVGIYLIATAILHNFVGYVLGYWLSRSVRLDESTCRTVAIEVGLQNGGMASGLAMNPLLFTSTSVALAPAIFGPWMNISGSVLATWWRRKPIKITENNKEKAPKPNKCVYNLP
ncbi:bile acid:sodium symporter family protein [Planctomycetota bacterium]